MIKFPSIEQFRNVVKQVQHRTRYVGKDINGEAIYDHTAIPPTLKFEGTVKLHGTNAGIVYDVASDSFSYQSRERELTLTADNSGFMLYMKSKEDALRKIVDKISQPFSLDKIVIFGEWCGQGIQKGVAISQLPKMFVIFAVEIFAENAQEWIEPYFEDMESPEDRIFHINRFGQWSVSVDFQRPELNQNYIGEITESVEACCPAGKHFGVEGIGEGVVWKCITPGWESSDYWFKVKGEKHSSSKVKTLAAVDLEAAQAVHDFVDRTVTEARLEQGIQNLVNEQQKPFDIKSMGDFLRWVYTDIIKEESDVIVASQLDPKKLGGPIANKARPWFMKKLQEA